MLWPCIWPCAVAPVLASVLCLCPLLFCRHVLVVAFHPLQNILASCCADKSIKLWNLDTGAELSTLSHSRYEGTSPVSSRGCLRVC